MSTKAEISWKEFQAVELRVATILEVHDFPEAIKPAYQLRLSLGPELGIKQSSAQVTNYSKDELLGRRVVCVCNFPKKKIADFWSEVLVLGVDSPKGGIALLGVAEDVEDGTLVY